MLTRSLRSVSISRTCGMFSRMTSSSVRMAAAMQGSAEFLAPEVLMVPRRGLPPRTTNLSIQLVYGDLAWKWLAVVVRVGEHPRSLDPGDESKNAMEWPPARSGPVRQDRMIGALAGDGPPTRRAATSWRVYLVWVDDAALALPLVGINISAMPDRRLIYPNGRWRLVRLRYS